MGPHAGMRDTGAGQRGGGYRVLLRWSGHRLGTWLVKEQSGLSLGGGGGGWNYSAFKADIPKMSLPPPFFVLLKLLWDPDGAMVQRVHEYRDVRMGQ